MKRSVIGALFVFIFSISFGQTFPFDLWHEGNIVLEHGDTIKGFVKYDLHDLLQVRHQNQMESFSPKKVVEFEIFDQSYKRRRIFYSLPYAADGDYKSPVFFEILSQGKITLLTREAIAVTTSSTGHIFYAPKIKRQLVNKYFLLKENGDIEKFQVKQNRWYELMHNKTDEVHTYVKNNKLDFDKKYDLKRIIDYYNSFY